MSFYRTAEVRRIIFLALALQIVYMVGSFSEIVDSKGLAAVAGALIAPLLIDIFHCFGKWEERYLMLFLSCIIRLFIGTTLAFDLFFRTVVYNGDINNYSGYVYLLIGFVNLWFFIVTKGRLARRK